MAIEINPNLRISPSAPSHLQDALKTPVRSIAGNPMSFTDFREAHTLQKNPPKPQRGKEPPSPYLHGPGSARSNENGIPSTKTMDFYENPREDELRHIEPNFSNVEQNVRETAVQFFNHWPEKFTFDAEHPNREKQDHRILYEIRKSRDEDLIIFPVREGTDYTEYGIRRKDFFTVIGQKDTFVRPDLETTGRYLNRDGMIFFSYLRSLSYNESPLDFSHITLRVSDTAEADDRLGDTDQTGELDPYDITGQRANLTEPIVTGTKNAPGAMEFETVSDDAREFFEKQGLEKERASEREKREEAIHEAEEGKRLHPDIIVPNHFIEEPEQVTTLLEKQTAPKYEHLYHSTTAGSVERWIQQKGDSSVSYFIVQVTRNKFQQNGSKPSFEEIAVPFSRDGVVEFIQSVGGHYDEERGYITVPPHYDAALIGKEGNIVRGIAKAMGKRNIMVISDIEIGQYESTNHPDPAAFVVRFDHTKLTGSEIDGIPNDGETRILQVIDGNGKWLLADNPQSIGAFANQFLAARIDGDTILCHQRARSRVFQYQRDLEQLLGRKLQIHIDESNGYHRNSPVQPTGWISSRMYEQKKI